MDEVSILKVGYGYYADVIYHSLLQNLFKDVS